MSTQSEPLGEGPVNTGGLGQPPLTPRPAPPQGEGPRKMQTCEECGREVPANWTIPFCSVAADRVNQCHTCLGRMVGPRGEPFPPGTTREEAEHMSGQPYTE